jgi:hypothetical protein
MAETANQVGVVDFADRVFVSFLRVAFLGLFLLFVRHAFWGFGLPSLL